MFFKKSVILHPGMRYQTMRHIISILLLAIYLPTVALSSIHVHHDTIDAHDDCLQCSGHFEKQHHHQHDCQYCTFLSLGYLGQAEGQSSIILPVSECCSAEIAAEAEMSRHGVSLLRAPPVA